MNDSPKEFSFSNFSIVFSTVNRRTFCSEKKLGLNRQDGFDHVNPQQQFDQVGQIRIRTEFREPEFGQPDEVRPPLLSRHPLVPGRRRGRHGHNRNGRSNGKTGTHRVIGSLGQSTITTVFVQTFL